jgi:hypothetical protein
MRILFAALVLALAQAQAFAQVPIGQVPSTDASVRGSVVLAHNGATIMSGAQITAGEKNSTLKLTRGGEVNVCSGSSITITSNNGRENLIALNSGAIETHYTLASNADTIMTPDFRLLLAGPGAFHFGITMTQRGDMCVQSLAGNASSIIVNEQLGESTHQVRPGEQVLFHNGHVDNASTNPGDNCGCPKQIASPTVAIAPEFKFPEQQSRVAAQAVASSGGPSANAPAIAPPPDPAPPQPGQVHMQVDAPMVFRADDVSAAAPGAQTLARNQMPPLPQTALQPVPAKPEIKPKKKWYQRFGSAFATVFGNPSKKQ